MNTEGFRNFNSFRGGINIGRLSKGECLILITILLTSIIASAAGQQTNTCNFVAESSNNVSPDNALPENDNDRNSILRDLSKLKSFKLTKSPEQCDDNSSRIISVLAGFHHSDIFERSSFSKIRKLAFALEKKYPDYRIVILMEGVESRKSLTAPDLKSLEEKGIVILGSEEKEMYDFMSRRMGNDQLKLKDIQRIEDIAGVKLKDGKNKQNCARMLTNSHLYLGKEVAERDKFLPGIVERVGELFPDDKIIVVAARGCAHANYPINEQNFDFILRENNPICFKSLEEDRNYASCKQGSNLRLQKEWKENKCSYEDNGFINPKNINNNCYEIIESKDRELEEEGKKIISECKKEFPESRCYRSGEAYFRGQRLLPIDSSITAQKAK